jgi:hypothetical protein
MFIRIHPSPNVSYSWCAPCFIFVCTRSNLTEQNRMNNISFVNYSWSLTSDTYHSAQCPLETNWKMICTRKLHEYNHCFIRVCYLNQCVTGGRRELQARAVEYDFSTERDRAKHCPADVSGSNHMWRISSKRHVWCSCSVIMQRILIIVSLALINKQTHTRWQSFMEENSTITAYCVPDWN